MNFPSLPNGYYQIVLLIILYSCYNQYQQDNKEIVDAQAKYEAAYNDYFLNYGNLSLDSLVTKIEIERITKKLDRIKKYLNSIKTPEAGVLVSHQIDSLMSRLNAATIKLRTITSKIDVVDLNFNISNSTLKLLKERSRWPFYIIMIVLGCFVLFQIGKEGLNIYQMNKIQLYKNRTYKHCQSCAKVFSPILLHGKNKDGITNEGFCIECYDNGEFKNPELTKQEVIDEIIKVNSIKANSKKLKPTIEKAKIEIMVDKMARWNKNPYVDSYEF